MNRSAVNRVLIAGLLVSTTLIRPVQAQDAPKPGPDQAEIRRALDLGNWNTRINALYELEDSGAQALPLLSYAAQDADWQVRHAAAHFLGQAGPQAAPALAELIKVEPCPEVRLAALKRLRDMGPAVRQYYAASAAPADEALLDENPGRYGNEHMGKPLVIDAPHREMTKEFFEGAADMRVCASSERSGHRDVEAAPAPEAPEKTATPPVIESPREGRVYAEVDGLLMAYPEALPQRPEPELDHIRARHGAAERFAAIRPLPDHIEEAAAEEYLTLPQRPVLAVGNVRSGHGAKETFGPIAPLPERETASTSADLEDDAGTGREAFDRIPVLIERLGSPDSGRRALAAELLGKRGTEAYAAVPALRRALKDPERRVRASAALALGDIGPPGRGVRSDLKRASRDKSEDVRSSAMLALRMIDAPR